MLGSGSQSRASEHELPSVLGVPFASRSASPKPKFSATDMKNSKEKVKIFPCTRAPFVCVICITNKRTAARTGRIIQGARGGRSMSVGINQLYASSLEHQMLICRLRKHAANVCDK